MKQVSRQRSYQLRKRAAGICIHCGKRPICAESKNFCAIDRQRLNDRRRAAIDSRRKTA